MRQTALLPTAVLPLLVLVAMLVFVGSGTANAEPGKNRITTQLRCSDGQDYTVTINGMGKAGHLEGTDGNLVIKRYDLTFYDPDSPPPDGEPIGGDAYEPKGNKNGQEGDLIKCAGQTLAELVGVGEVIVVFDLEAFITPRANG
jgi:hypothetical protein